MLLVTSIMTACAEKQIKVVTKKKKIRRKVSEWNAFQFSKAIQTIMLEHKVVMEHR